MCVFVICLFFFFKQKTAYEMRISDWSSDVCSSDLSARVRTNLLIGAWIVPARIARAWSLVGSDARRSMSLAPYRVPPTATALTTSLSLSLAKSLITRPTEPGPSSEKPSRSEEHTSELQSLIRISYAVFCLKKKKQQKQTNNKYQLNYNNNSIYGHNLLQY